MQIPPLPTWTTRSLCDTPGLDSGGLGRQLSQRSSQDAVERREGVDDVSECFERRPQLHRQDELAKDLAAERTAKTTTARELAIFKAASAAGADPAKLLDSNSFMTSVQGLDPTDGAAVAAAITAAVTANASLKAARAAGASTVDLGGGSGEQGQITEQQLKTMTPEQISAAFDKGQLKSLLG